MQVRSFDGSRWQQPQDDTLNQDNGGVSGPDYSEQLDPLSVSVGDSWAHSAPALVSGSQPVARLSEPRFDAYSSRSLSFSIDL